MINVISAVYDDLLKNTSKENIQILAPIYKGTSGINEINTAIQSRFNDNENIEYAKLDEVKAKLVRLDALTKNMIAAVNSSVTAKNGSAIAAAFLNINDIDKIARDLAAM